MLTTPIIGLAIASSSSPIARMNARCGVRLIPSLVMSDLSFVIGFRLFDWLVVRTRR
jgi:hypothetical protein